MAEAAKGRRGRARGRERRTSEEDPEERVDREKERKTKKKKKKKVNKRREELGEGTWLEVENSAGERKEERMTKGT